MLEELLRKPIRLLPLALASMGFECATSVNPVTDFDEGFLDRSITGTWRLLGSDGEIEDMPSLRVDIDDSELMSVLISDFFCSDSGLALSDLYLGHSSIVAERKYLNMRFVDCIGGEIDDDVAEFMADMKADNCPYQIFRYATEDEFPAHRRELEESGYSLPLLELLEEDLVAISAAMDVPYVEAAISEGLVEGDLDCESCVLGSGCITAEGEALRQFFERHDSEIFPPDDWAVLVRLPTDFDISQWEPPEQWERPERWEGFVYPNAVSEPTNARHLGEFDTVNECEDAARAELRLRDAVVTGGFECGVDCGRDTTVFGSRSCRKKLFSPPEGSGMEESFQIIVN